MTPVRRTDMHSSRLQATGLGWLALLMLTLAWVAMPCPAAAQNPVAAKPETVSDAIDSPGATPAKLAPKETAPADEAAPEKETPESDPDETQAQPTTAPARLVSPAARLAIVPTTPDGDEEQSYFEGGEELDDRDLAARISQTLGRPGLDGLRIGLHVQDIDNGEVWIDHHGDTPLNPASNMKLITTATALSALGPDFRFKTEFRAAAPLDTNGVLHGDLSIVGFGNPWMVVEELYRLAAELHAIGLRRIEGDILIDDRYFDAVREGPGWEQDDTDNAYQAPMGALSANFNSIAVYILPGEEGQPARVSLLPLSRYAPIENSAVTENGRRTRLIVHSVKTDTGNKITVEGHIHPKASRRVFFLKADNPPLYAGWAIHDALKQLGITCTGYVKSRPASSDAKPFFTFRSPRLPFIIGKINKHSNNHMAEQLIKTMGAEIHGVPGSWEKGIDVVQTFLQTTIGVSPDAYVMRNGSGLGDVNQIPPALFTRLLAHMANDPELGPDFISAQAVAGRDGTLRKRFQDTDVANRLRGKTGSLEQVMALSGYLYTRDGRRLAVSILFNDCLGKNRLELKQVQDEIILLLANHRVRPTGDNAVAEKE